MYIYVEYIKFHSKFHSYEIPRWPAAQVAIPSELSLDDLCHFLGHREGLEAVRVVFRSSAPRVFGNGLMVP